jgi:putative ATP-binding cassette transporter
MSENYVVPRTEHEHFLRQVWAMVTPYWRSAERSKAWLLLAVVIVLELADVGVSVGLNQWYRYFYNALQNHDLSAFIRLVLIFCAIASVAILMAVYRLYLTQMLTIGWRRWLSEKYFATWVRDKNYYRLERGGYTDNPDQRLADDIDGFTSSTLGLSLGLLRNLVSLASFSVILWGLSGSFELLGIQIPGYMFWVALLYASIGSVITHYIARRLIGLNNQQQRYEADMRFGLVRVRENAESIALYHGEANENQRLMDRFAKVWSNYWSLMKVQKRLTFFTSGYGQAAVIFPLLVAAPRYFAGKIELGELMQINSAFGNVQSSMSWFIDAYASLASWRATCDRLLSFDQAMAGNAAQKPLSMVGQGGSIEIDNLRLPLGDGRELAVPRLSLLPGKHVLLGGSSGTGKSTLLRAMAGLLDKGSGQLTMPAATSLFLPQKPYLPVGTLAAVLCYPASPSGYTTEAMQYALQRCRLDGLLARLDETAHWQQILSPGEQQRLAIARALLLAPAWLFLDEATSALDEADESQLYRALVEALPGTTLISVGHRRSLYALHQRHLLIRAGELVAG